MRTKPQANDGTSFPLRRIGFTEPTGDPLPKDTELIELAAHVVERFAVGWDRTKPRKYNRRNERQRVAGEKPQWVNMLGHVKEILKTGIAELRKENRMK